MTRSRNRFWRAAVAVALLVPAMALVSSSTPAEAQAGGCNPSVRNFTSSGPFSTRSDRLNSTTTVYRPRNLGTNGCSSHPVLLWGNGTFTSPGLYGSFLNHLASHGFVVAAANTSNAGSGREMLRGLDTLISQRNSQINTNLVGSFGHSQGGGGAINAAKDRRVTVTVPIKPWLQNEIGLDADAFFISGASDIIVSDSSVRRRFTGVGERIPAAYGELRSDGHNSTLGNGGPARGPTTAFFRWRLMGDSNAASQFLGSSCGYCNDRDFSRFDRNRALQNLSAGSGGGGGSECGLLDRLLGRCNNEPAPPPTTTPPTTECGLLDQLLGRCNNEPAPPPTTTPPTTECGLLDRLLGRC